MRLDEYAAYDATGLAELVRRREVTALELIQLAREAHDHLNPKINAVVEFYDDAESVSGSETGAFSGVPFLRKDAGPSENGRLQEQGSRLLRGYRSTVESYFIERARSGGLHILGRTTMPEFGTTGLSDSIACGVTRNPWNLERTAGGSSSGSAAAVAAGVVPLASGGDGGGSIRIPASNCGLVGLNPSRGRISGGPNRQDAGYGSVRNFVLCRTVRDMTIALDVFHGSYPGDPFLIAAPRRPYAEELKRPTGRLRIGVATSPWGGSEVAPAVADAVVRTATELEEQGHNIEEIPSPYVNADYRKVVAGMFHMGLTSLEAIALALGRSINDQTVEHGNLELYRVGKSLPLSYAPDIFEYSRKIRSDVGESIKDFDILVTPTMPFTALANGTYTTSNKDLTADDLMDADASIYQFLGVFNVTGHPSVSLPLFEDSEAMPVGIQLVGRCGDEATLVRLARDLEEAFPWSKRQPPVHVAHANLDQLAEY